VTNVLKTLDTVPRNWQTKLTTIIEDLCKTHDIEIQWNDTMPNRADHAKRMVRLKRIVHADRFASCLHEIGHLLIDRSGTELDQEFRAWNWAIKWADANRPFDKSCWQAVVVSLGRYVEKYQTEAPIDHPALALLAEAKGRSVQGAAAVKVKRPRKPSEAMIKAQKKRESILTHIEKEVKKDYGVESQLDSDARALYWVAPWNHRRYLKDEKGKWKKDKSGDTEFVVEKSPLPAIHMYVANWRLFGTSLLMARSGMHVTGPHRCLGMIDGKTLVTSREYGRNWHRKLGGWTVNLHILRYAKQYGLEDVELNGKKYTVEHLLTCPLVERKHSGGYEQNVLVIDPENRLGERWGELITQDSPPKNPN
jgi:hypothetical protein